MPDNTNPLLVLEHLSREFSVEKKQLYAVRDVSLTINRGECLGIVGESGCGKSTLAKMVIGSLPPTSGTVSLDGTNVWALKGRERRRFRRRIQMVFQDPVSSFNPRMTIGTYLCEPLVNYEKWPKARAMEEAKRLLGEVELPEEFVTRYPHQLSGGQLQRVAIARAIAISPELLVCDEATGALDVSIQNQIVRLLVRLQNDHGISCMFIGHDLSLVRSASQRIAVMYLGSVAEILESETLVQEARHPYTLALLDAVFEVYGDQNKEIHLLTGDPPSPLNLPPGCPFAGRCERCKEICRREKPPLVSLGPSHQVACHLVQH